MEQNESSDMKHQTILITVFSAAALAVGCKKEPTTSQQIENVQTEARQAAQELQDYTYAQKEEFVKQMQSRLNALNQDLDKLSAKIDGSSDAVKTEARPKLQALRDQAARLSKQLDEVKNATESTWDTVKDGAKKAWTSLKSEFQQARQWASDRIAP